MLRSALFIRVFTLLLLSAIALPAQSPTGEIAGVVRDPSGAVVPNASIEVVNQNTGARQVTTSNEAGEFVISQLPSGTYAASVKPPAGFRPVDRRDLALTALQHLRVDFTLEIGDATQTVNVTAEAPLVDSSSPMYGMLVDDRRIKDLPLNGRNSLDLVNLTPGVNSVSTTILPTYTQQVMHINGGRQTGVNFLLDGGPMDYFHRGAGLELPPPDALQEFRVVTVGTPAEYGRGSVVISAVTKSGTNDLHASAWEFLRNDAFDARNFCAADNSKLRYDQFGLVAGAPVLIPKLYNGRNRTFWLFSYQGLRISQDELSAISVPITPAQSNGDFSSVKGGVRDPLTNQPFPENQIPVSRFDPVAVRVLTDYSHLANRPNGNYQSQAVSPTTGNQFVGRFDQELGTNNHLSFRYFEDDSSSTDPYSGSSFTGYSPFASDLQLQTGTIEDIHSFSPQLVNSFRVTFTRFNYDSANQTRSTLVQLGATDFAFAGGPATLPTLNIVGRSVFTVGDDLTRLSDAFAFAEDLSFYIGKHQWKFGAEVERNRFRYLDNNNSGGTFKFDGSQSGDPMADFLLGRAANFQQASPIDTDQRYTPFGIYAQDTWKATPRLTVSLGLRAEFYPPWQDTQGKLTSFVPGAQSVRFPTAPAGLVFPGDPAFPYRADNNNWGPRVGLAWDVFGDGRTSVRSSFGIFYEPFTAEMTGGVLAPQPFGLVVNNNVVQLSAPYQGRVDPFPYTVTPANAQFITPITVPKSYSPDLRVTYTMNYSFGIQRQLGNNYMLEVAYVGNGGRKIPMLREADIAQVTPTATLANLSSRRIYAPTFDSIGELYSDATSNYNSLQIQLHKRLSRGFSLGSTFTWAKAMDEISLNQAMAQLSQQGYQNPLNRNGEYGPSDFDRRCDWASSLLYELPFLRGTQWYARILGGWELAAIGVLYTGSPIELLSGQDYSLTGIDKDRPDVIGNWQLPSGRSRSAEIQEYFNTAAFTVNPRGVYGNAGRNIIDGPGTVSLDTSLSKAFRLTEKQRLQLRFDAFNVPNNVNLSGPVGKMNSPLFGQITSAGAARIMQVSAKYSF